MRMRERPLIGTLAREATFESHPPSDGCCVDVCRYSAPRRLFQLPSQLKGRVDHPRGPQYRHFNGGYSRLFHSSSDLDLSSVKTTTTTRAIKDALINSVTKQRRFMPPKTAVSSCLSSEPLRPVRSTTSISIQDHYNSTTSLHFEKKLLNRDLPPFYPKGGMTTRLSAFRTSSPRNNNSSTTALTRIADNVKYTTANASTQAVNKSSGQWIIRGSNPGNNNDKKLTRRTLAKDIVKCGVKNSYRNFDETIFELSSDRGKDEGSTGASVGHADDDTRSSVNGQLADETATYRRMSAPDLPPISSSASQKGDKRKISFNSVLSTGVNTSTSQHTTSFSSRTSYSRRSSAATADIWADAAALISAEQQQNVDPGSTCGNLNDPTNPNPRSNGSSPNIKPGNDSLSSSISLRKVHGSSRSQGSESMNGYTREAKKLTNFNITLSLCATDVQDSQKTLKPQMETTKNTIDEGISNSTSNKSTSNITNTLIDEYNINQARASIKKTINNKRITTKSTINEMPSMARSSRSVSLNRTTTNNNHVNNEGAKQTKNTGIKTNTIGWNKAQVINGETFTNTRGMTRSKSENKLTNNFVQRISAVSRDDEAAKRRAFTRNISVDRFGQNSQPVSRALQSHRANRGGNFKLMRSESSTNLYIRDGRYAMNGANRQGDEQYHDDDDTGKLNPRVMEWVCEVNSVQRYEIDPRDEVVDYSDEPPQTDTAIHLVYQGE